MNEVDRIRRAYEKRDRQGKGCLYSCLNPAQLLSMHQRETLIIRELGSGACPSLSDSVILDAGCATGGVLRDFVKYGASPEMCHGIDLMPDRVETARRLSPNIDFREGNAESIPFEDASFDIVLCFTLLSSILDAGMRGRVAGELLRVLKAGGVIIWYDFHMDNPANPDVRGVRKGEISDLFSGCDITLRRTTLAPPLARALAPYSLMLCQVLEKVPLLCTHYLGMIRKKQAR